MSKFFTDDELKCPCCGAHNMAPAFVERLDRLRELYAKPMKLTSGYRCKKHNLSVGGKQSSMHLLGRAVDIAIADGRERYQLMRLAFSLGFTGIASMQHALHIDDRDTAATVWLYATQATA